MKAILYDVKIEASLSFLFLHEKTERFPIVQISNMNLCFLSRNKMTATRRVPVLTQSGRRQSTEQEVEKKQKTKHLGS